MSEIGIKNQCFGMEVEMTGITHERAAQTLAEYFGSSPQYIGGVYDAWSVTDPEGKTWKLMSDASIQPERRTVAGYVETDDRHYMVTPKLTYAELPKLQECVRQVRHAGAKANSSGQILSAPPAWTSSSQAPYPSPHRKGQRQGSLIPLLLLSPQIQRTALRGPQCPRAAWSGRPRP